MRKMFVGGLHPNLTTQSLIAYFSQFGKIEKGIIMTDKKTGKSRGFGFIVFKKKETIDVIMSYSNCHFLCGKWIECKRTKPKNQNIKMINDNNKNPNVNYYKNLNDESKKNSLFKNNNDINNNNENSSIENSNLNNIYENNVVVNNYFAKKGQALYGDKYLYEKNLFMYQNYIPRKKIKYFLNNNNSGEKENNLENNNNLIKSENQISDSKNEINFQNYFQNIIINPSTYNYFHYKLFDSRGIELSKLKNYNNSSKITLFSNENNINNNNNNDLNNKNNVKNNVLNVNNLNNSINNNIKNNNNDNNINKNISNTNIPKLSLFNNSNIDDNLKKYQNQKQQILFEDTKSPKMIFIKENKEEKNINNNNNLFNNNSINDNNNQINNNNFGPDRSHLGRKEKYKRFLGINENYQPY